MQQAEAELEEINKQNPKQKKSTKPMSRIIQRSVDDKLLLKIVVTCLPNQMELSSLLNKLVITTNSKASRTHGNRITRF